MGLKGLKDVTGSSDSGQLRAAPGLAQVLQDEGTRDENANILNLFLNNTNLKGGAPQPITDNVGSIPVSSTFVFNSNFTRERYGKAAVSDNITVQSDRISLLINDNQSKEGRALSLISSLEFQNGLNAVQAMSNTQVTNTNQPDLDKFSKYPESLFNNATLLNSTKETFVFDAINASQQATDALASYES
jgi:hypothetical protein